MKNIGRFIKNGLLLSVVSILLRTIGVAFNTFITARVGAAGTGLYQLVLSIYSPALTLATAGVNLAASRLVAEELGKDTLGLPRKVLTRCLQYAACASSLVGALVFLLSEYIALHWLGDGAAVELLRTLAVGLPFISLSSAMNGYFTAIRRVSRTAFVQLLEQGIRILLTLLFLSRTASGDNVACLTAVVAASVATDGFSFIFTLLLCRHETRKHTTALASIAEPLPRILAITLPVSVSSFLRSGLVALEHMLIPRGLKAGGTSYEAAMAAYGTLSGMSLPIVLFPASFLYSFSGLLIPELAEAKEQRQHRLIRRTAERVIGTVLLFGIGVAGLLFSFAEELGITIYRSTEAGYYIRMLAPLIPFMYLDSAVDAMLKGLGEQVFTMKVNIIDAFVSVIAVWFLVPRLGLNGYIVVIYLSEMINFSFSYARLHRVTQANGHMLRRSFLPLTAVLLSVFAVQLLPLPSGTITATALGLSIASMLYLSLLLLFGVISGRRLAFLLTASLGRQGQGHKTKQPLI